MRVSQIIYRPSSGWYDQGEPGSQLNGGTNLVLVFGSRELLSESRRYDELKARFPGAHIVLNTTSGEIFGTSVFDETITATAVEFDKTKVVVKTVNIKDEKDSYAAGKTLASKLDVNDLAYVLIISDGQMVNGSELVKGIHEVLPVSIPVTGGLAGDGAKFEQTLVGVNEAPSRGNIVAVGFYGKSLKVGHGSMGGWDDFGPEREVTKSESNVLYELDGKNALEMYKMYLGDHAKELPGAALLFPLSLKSDSQSEEVVRTILSIDESARSMTFAGDIPKGSIVRFMKANFDKLVDGASGAAQKTLNGLRDFKPELLILISCVGRKLVLDQRIEEEVEVVQEVFGKGPRITGFYSYGEISPFNPSSSCQLHNQTMTITALGES